MLFNFCNGSNRYYIKDIDKYNSIKEFSNYLKRYMYRKKVFWVGYIEYFDLNNKRFLEYFEYYKKF
jgi:hypothetical protein